MDDIELLIIRAAERVLPGLTADQVRGRVARRGTATLQRPPRAWCLAVRAGDTRITAWDAVVVPGHALDDPSTGSGPSAGSPSAGSGPSAGSPSAGSGPSAGPSAGHTVTLDARLVGRLCEPVRIERPGQGYREVARLLGVTPGA